MLQLGFDLFDEHARERIEKMFWQLTERLLQLGQSVILESGFWLALSATRNASVPAHSVQPSSCMCWMSLSTSCGVGSKSGIKVGGGQLAQLRVKSWTHGRRSSRPRTRRSLNYLTLTTRLRIDSLADPDGSHRTGERGSRSFCG